MKKTVNFVTKIQPYIHCLKADGFTAGNHKWEDAVRTKPENFMVR